jgi:hypothetical protein
MQRPSPRGSGAWTSLPLPFARKDGYVEKRFSRTRYRARKASLTTRRRNLGPVGEGDSLPDNDVCGLRRSSSDFGPCRVCKYLIRFD